MMDAVRAGDLGRIALLRRMMMSDEKSLPKELLDKLKQQRDELAVKIHLGSMEAKDEFERAKARIADLERDMAPVRDAVDESAKNVGESVRLVGEELLGSFKRIRDSLK